MYIKIFFLENHVDNLCSSLGHIDRSIEHDGKLTTSYLFVNFLVEKLEEISGEGGQVGKEKTPLSILFLFK